MKGQNEITVNQATMVEWVQEVLDRKFIKSPGDVSRVIAKTVNGISAFTIVIREEEDDER